MSMFTYWHKQYVVKLLSRLRRYVASVNQAKKKLLLPKPKTDYLKYSFSYSAAILLNNLPKDIRTSNSLGFFKRSSHRWFSDQYSHTAHM